jgi:hypothetical protein
VVTRSPRLSGGIHASGGEEKRFSGNVTTLAGLNTYIGFNPALIDGGRSTLLRRAAV